MEDMEDMGDMGDGDRLAIWWPWKKFIHLGDAWASLNAGLFIAKQNRLKSITLAVARMKRGGCHNINFIRDLLQYLDYGDLKVRVVAMTRHEQLDENKDQITGPFNKMGIPI